ncbi:5'/3'-nucleotidase SurE [Roseovarius sp. LXJ103]|uniref:5'/3'-nucleotidase SurE n=1 Tax=Roseovarius carneus TaxID=2853164 RepID=UPI000D60F455|nr:5'/3'-nucleotidase SurE [Roseovarius carneus]MBZ8119307.1 5'/3'-nucleotidase SurE [Roseovarius carneus]PWE35077.1 5'/3'-nucleotidase SurE [Pelagicola sp. LXJ1103]
MRILITNDDGITAPGLEVMTEIADALAGPGGEVWCVAPAFEQSGVGHCISYTNPMMLSEMSMRRYAVQGSPADCVLAALHHLMPKRPDLVLSGVNRGNNAAENAVYSGTVGAAMEAALQGVPAIALSQYYGPLNKDLDDKFESARQHGLATVQRLLDKGVWTADDYGIFYNVNFPPVPGADVKGLRAARQGFRRDMGFGVKPVSAPSGRQFLWVTGAPQGQPTSPGSDASLNLEGYITATPMRADLTAHDVLEPLKAIE